jgi:hypothetical protein
MRNNPFDHASGNHGRMSNPADTNNPLSQAFAFATPPKNLVAPDIIPVPRETVDTLKSLLSNMTDTFREHGMFELADEAETVVALL